MTTIFIFKEYVLNNLNNYPSLQKSRRYHENDNKIRGSIKTEKQ